MTSPGFNKMFRAIAGVIVLLSMGATVGCTGDKVAYHGPYIDASPVNGKYSLTCFAPTPGWDVGIDREVFIPVTAREVYLTIRRPDPNQIYAQTIIEHRLPTTLNSFGPLFVYARVVDADQPVTDDNPEYVTVQMFRP